MNTDLPKITAMSTNKEESESRQSQQPPGLVRQVWNLAGSLASFVADGCNTLTKQEYETRLKICHTCDQRRGNRCLKCGCRLSLKARGRAFQCPLNKWPPVSSDAPDS